MRLLKMAARTEAADGLRDDPKVRSLCSTASPAAEGRLPAFGAKTELWDRHLDITEGRRHVLVPVKRVGRHDEHIALADTVRLTALHQLASEFVGPRSLGCSSHLQRRRPAHDDHHRRVALVAASLWRACRLRRLPAVHADVGRPIAGCAAPDWRAASVCQRLGKGCVQLRVVEHGDDAGSRTPILLSDAYVPRRSGRNDSCAGDNRLSDAPHRDLLLNSPKRLKNTDQAAAPQHEALTPQKSPTARAV